eukprot:15021977-Ditylum_brightwellii.AAC.1
MVRRSMCEWAACTSTLNIVQSSAEEGLLAQFSEKSSCKKGNTQRNMNSTLNTHNVETHGYGTR